jgi:lipoprotein-anchoring transpeptidase ErfK/SrfK
MKLLAAILGFLTLAATAQAAATDKARYLIEVNKAKNVLVLWDRQNLLKTYVVSTGRKGSTPEGTFKIVEKIPNPTWYKPGGPVYPPNDPQNGLGSRWMGFDRKGYGIHGTIEPWLLGKSVSHGCVRMKNEDVEELFEIVPRGTPVRITG